MRRRIKPRRPDLKYDVPRTFEVLNRYDVRVLHAHFGYTGSQVLPVRKRTGLPLITTFYGHDISALARSTRWRQAYAQLFVQGDVFLVEGPSMRRRLVDLGCPPEKAGVQRIALHLDNYPFRQRLPKRRGETVRVLFCGRFLEKKGLIYALDAVRRARDRFSDLEFRLVGDGELRPQVERAIERYQMGSYTVLVGFQSHRRLIEEMDRADIFIHPSVTAADGDSEGGAPTTILEAQACGLPIVSTMHADIPSVVVPGQSALLAPERDADTLSRHLCALLRAPEKWATMGLRGRAFLEQYHNMDIEALALEDRYYSLAGLPKPW
jgi:colanic acid/amylovoran biosynthesis glycosyltransferase